MGTRRQGEGREGKEEWKEVERAARPFIRMEEREEWKVGRYISRFTHHVLRRRENALDHKT
jgi:hypothetical protein